MDQDELEPEPKTRKPRDLEGMSIEALDDYIADLEAEIARAKNMITAKQAVRGDAEEIFRE